MQNNVWAVFWSFIDKVSYQLVTLVVGIALARLLSPADFGLIGMLTIFINISNVFIESGFSNALIRKLDVTEWDYSTAFYVNVGIGIVAYIILLIISPWVADFFNVSILTKLLCLIGINVLLNSLCIVQNAILTSKLKIRIQTLINIGSQLPMGCIAIGMAYYGCGVWALAIQSVGYTLVRTILFWYFAEWRPKSGISKQSFSYLFHFGSKLVCANLLGTFFNEIYSFIIGRHLGGVSLGLYTNARRLGEQPSNLFSNMISKVGIPLLSQHQDSSSDLLDYYRRIIEWISFIMFPVMFLLILIAKPLILLLCGVQWEDCIPLFQILCLGFVWQPLGSVNLSLLQVVNRTGTLLKLDVYKKGLLIIILLISIRHGILGIVVGKALYDALGTFVNLSAARSILSYSYKQQIIDISKYLIVALLSMLIVGYLIWKLEIGIILTISVFSLLYLALGFMSRLSACTQLRNFIVSYYENRKSS